MCLSLFCLRPFCSQSLSKCPRPESISVLKRPSDSGAALFSVTPRDRSPVRLWRCVRSTASNNAAKHYRTSTSYSTQTLSDTAKHKLTFHTSLITKCIKHEEFLSSTGVCLKMSSPDKHQFMCSYLPKRWPPPDKHPNCSASCICACVCSQIQPLIKHVYLLGASTMCQTNQAVDSTIQRQEKPIPLNENEKRREDRDIVWRG